MPYPYFRNHNEILYEPIYNKEFERAEKLKKLWLSMNKDLIDKLIIDRYFDIYTRNGLDYIVKDLESNPDNVLKKLNGNPLGRIFLLDFDNVRGMNKELGYTKVNDIFKKTFSELKEQYIIGRAFSGDEIFFISDNPYDNIDTIKNVCDNNELTFTHIEEYYFYDDIKEKLEKMIENFH